MLVTLDVASLYTNIAAVDISLTTYRGNRCNPLNSSLLQLLEKVLKCNYFDFHGRHFLQVGGTAMGTKVAPSYANTFMGWFEETYVYTYHLQPLVWKRFIDDIFLIWQYGETELNLFISYLNNCMNCMKFEAEKSTRSVHFLDTTVNVDQDGILTTSLYTKPTDSHNYINFHSCHPRACNKGIPYSQFLRLRRICSSTDDFVKESKMLAFYFHKAEYPITMIQSASEKACLRDRKSLLAPTPIMGNTQEESPSSELFLITTFHPFFNGVNNIVTENWKLLDRSSSTRPLMESKITRGFRRAKNLRDHLVRAKISPIPSHPNNHTGDSGMTPTNVCTTRRCSYCVKLDTTGRIMSTYNKKEYMSRKKITCRSSNLVYCLHCNACGKEYVGQTKRRLVERLSEHFPNIRQNRDAHIVGRHYNLPGHSGIQNMSVYILEFVSAPPDSDIARELRERAEKKWIFRLRSMLPHGLNLMD